MKDKSNFIPDSTAVRVALWRAMHVQIDALPHVLEDEIGLQLVAPAEGWRERPDMHPQGTAPFRASIVARARFIEDKVIEECKLGINQYVILGSGLDTFAQRRVEDKTKLHVFEVEKSETLAWKKERLIELGFEIPSWLKFVPMNFENASTLWDQLIACGFEKNKPAIVTSIGVSMYLTREAIKKMLIQMTSLAPGSKFIMTFMLPLEMTAPEDQEGYQRSLKGAQASGTPFISFFSPDKMMELALEVGFKHVEHLSVSSLKDKYFTNRIDGLKPSTGEELLIVTI